MNTIILSNFFTWIYKIIKEYYYQLLLGIGRTLLLAITGTIIGLLIALIFSFIKTRHEENLINKIHKVFVDIYVTVFRGTPMMVQALIFYYLFKMMGINWSPLSAGIFTISLNTAAYLTEVLRGGIESVDSGQYEAARSIGLTEFKTSLLVIYPQALKNSFASIGNEFIVNVKDSSVLNVIGIIEVYNACMMSGNKYYKVVEAMTIAAIIYLVMTLISSKILKMIEKKIGSPVKEITSSN